MRQKPVLDTLLRWTSRTRAVMSLDWLEVADPLRAYTFSPYACANECIEKGVHVLQVQAVINEKECHVWLV